MRMAIRFMIAFFAMTASSMSFAAICSVGDQASVTWKGAQYPARVLRVNETQTRCYIKYTNYGDEWNEWVGADRIRITSGGGQKSTGDDYSFAVGESVSVKWKGTWYPASVLSRKGGKYKIHYDGYNSSWDEWVGDERIRAR